MSGGHVDSLFVNDSSKVTMSGGTIGPDLRLINLAELIIDGSDFAIDGIPFDYGNITSIFGGSTLNEPFRTLTGTLANGDILNNQFQIGDNASITLVPEPTTILLLGLGAVVLRRKR
jgi:hypothetical protein